MNTEGVNVYEGNKYIICSFPNQKGIHYLHLPDTYWRPLVIGNLPNPQALAVDALHSRLFVADQTNNNIYWYQLFTSPDGQLETDGTQHVALEGYNAYWMAVNGVGDLYFTGKQTVPAPESSYDAIWRLDANRIAIADMSVIEVYSRSNSGQPNPAVWMPSGIAVDSFNIYWGNQEKGKDHGSVVQGSRQNIGKKSDIQLSQLSVALNEVRGMADAGTRIAYVSPSGIYAVEKSRAGDPFTEENDGLIALPPGSDSNGQFDPRSIAWDGYGTMYLTDMYSGRIYTVPCLDNNQHTLTVFADAPGVFGIALLRYTGLQSRAVRTHLASAVASAVAAWLVSFSC